MLLFDILDSAIEAILDVCFSKGPKSLLVSLKTSMQIYFESKLVSSQNFIVGLRFF